MTEWTLLASGETNWKQITPDHQRKLLWARLTNDADEIHSVVVPVVIAKKEKLKWTHAHTLLMTEARDTLSRKLEDYGVEL